MTDGAETRRDEPRFSSVVGGFFLGLLLQILALPLTALWGLRGGYAFLTVIMFIGVAQLVYMVPAIAIAAMTGRRRLMKGLIIAGAVVALLNATCWGIAIQ